MEENLSKELDLQIKGAEKPSMWELLAVRFILLPYTIGKVRMSAQNQHYFTKSSEKIMILLVLICCYVVLYLALTKNQIFGYALQVY